MTPDAARTLPPATADAAATLPPGDSHTTTGSAAAAIEHLNTDATLGPQVARTPAVDVPPGFVIDRELGVGGMGVVYLARQVGLNRPVALKVVKGGAAVDSKALIRFLAEAEAVAAIKHPNVVEVYQYGEHAGNPYMVLEFCPGGDLTALVSPTRKRGASEPGEATTLVSRDAAWFRRVAELMAQVADGVNAAHALGIVHRDLKPHNVFLAADGSPKVADFGLAKRGVGSDLTQTGAVMGTPAYMSPEQAGQGTKFVGPEADVWALGVMLYELCCGELPIDTSGNLLDTLVRVAMGEVSPLRTKAPTVPTDLSLIVHKCLSLDPRDRYPTAGGLAEDLRHWLDGKPISARKAGAVEQAVKWAKRNKKLAGMGLAVLLTMTVATGVSLGFGLESNKQAGEARREKKNAEDAAEQTRLKSDALAAQLKETRRVLDLSLLAEANAAWERNNAAVARTKLAEVATDNRCLAWQLLNRRFKGSDLTLWGHTGAVNSVAYSPNGSRIASGSSDGTVRVWDSITGQTLAELKGDPAGVMSVAFSPDGTRLATGTWDGASKVWDVTTGQAVLTFEGNPRGVSHMAYSPDGTRLATAGSDAVIRMWDPATGRKVGELVGHVGAVSWVAISPDGTRLATTSADQTCRVWDAATGRTLIELKGNTDWLTSVTFSPDGHRLATACWDGKARVWDVATGRPLVELSGHAHGLTEVTFSPDGHQLATASADQTVRVWDATTGRSLVELTGHVDRVTCVGFSPDGTRIVTGSWDKEVRVWDAATGRGVVEHKRQPALVSVGLSSDSNRLVTAGSDQKVQVWDTATGRNVWEVRGHAGNVYHVAFSADGTRLANACDDRIVRVYETSAGRILAELKGRTSATLIVTFSPDGTRLASAGTDGGLQVWDTATWQSVTDWIAHKEGVLSVAYSPDGTRLATASVDGTARVWDAATGRSFTELKGHSGWVGSVAFSPDGTRVVTGSGDNTARVWDLDSRKNCVELKGHSKSVNWVGFSPDGTRVVTGSGDGTARVWDTVTGRALVELRGGYAEGVKGVAFSTDGRQLVTTSGFGTTRVWETAAEIDGPDREVTKADLGRRLARPRPEVHAKLAEQHKADPFAAAVQRSLEQKARGQLAAEACDFDTAWGHFIAAEVLRPKPQSIREVLPAPRGTD
jgi:WD40 repeat protein